MTRTASTAGERRAELEHRPEGRDDGDDDGGRGDPAVVLDAMRLVWDSGYRIGFDDGQWWFERRDGKGGRETAATPDDLARMIADDHGLLPVRATAPPEPFALDAPHVRYGSAAAEIWAEWRDAFGIAPPAHDSEPWVGTPRRPELPAVTGGSLADLVRQMKAAAAVSGLADVRRLEDEHPGWTVWRAGCLWWATRQQFLTAEQAGAGLRSTVGGVRRPPDLMVLLEHQDKLEAWAAEHQWQVPGEVARRTLGLPPERAAAPP